MAESVLPGVQLSTAPPPTGNLAELKDQVFVLKEGVNYRVKITFKVRCPGGPRLAPPHPAPPPQHLIAPAHPPQVNREIVSGLKCVHHTYRHGLRGEDRACGERAGG